MLDANKLKISRARSARLMSSVSRTTAASLFSPQRPPVATTVVGVAPIPRTLASLQGDCGDWRSNGHANNEKTFEEAIAHIASLCCYDSSDRRQPRFISSLIFVWKCFRKLEGLVDLRKSPGSLSSLSFCFVPRSPRRPQRFCILPPWLI